ncbi:class I SAM-dependent methyltransferase [Bacillus sp. JJ664]
MKKQVIDSFNQLSVAYENTVDHESPYNTHYERPAMMLELDQNLDNYQILDAGCAAGWYTDALLKRGATVTAIDISQSMVEAAKRRVGNNANILCHDLEDTLPFQNETFHIIISSLTLHYIKDWNSVFKEFKRVLKPNGILLFSIHHPFSDYTIFKSENYFSKELLTDEWMKAGKEIEVVFYRRPLHEIIQSTVNHFTLSSLIEPQPIPELKNINPKAYLTLSKEPRFLMIKAVKNNK